MSEIICARCGASHHAEDRVHVCHEGEPGMVAGVLLTPEQLQAARRAVQVYLFPGIDGTVIDPRYRTPEGDERLREVLDVLTDAWVRTRDPKLLAAVGRAVDVATGR